MTAFPTSRPAEKTRERYLKLLSDRQRRQRQNPLHDQATAKSASTPSAELWESVTVLGVNFVLIGTALCTLVQLVPYQLKQHTKLQEIQAEERQLAARVEQLQQEYQQNSKPDAVPSIVEQQSNLISPKKHRIVFLPPSKATQQSDNGKE